MKIKLITLLFVLTVVSCGENKEPTVDHSKVIIKDVGQRKQIPDGDFVKKFPNGNVQMNGSMYNNNREGLWTSYYKNGFKQSESSYKKGILHGRTASFYNNGQVRYIGYFLNGKKDGKWEFYSEDGEFEKSELFEKGKIVK